MLGQKVMICKYSIERSLKPATVPVGDASRAIGNHLPNEEEPSRPLRENSERIR